MNPNFQYPSNSVLVHYAEIDQTDRARIDFGNLEELASSIKLRGLIHPPTVSISHETNKVTLIAGGRRIAAMRMLGVEYIPTVEREKLHDHEIAELEAEENFQRLGMKWQEKVILIARTHELKTKAGVDCESWTIAQTGNLFGLSAASVSHCRQIRQFLIDGDEAILAASSIKAAYEILLKRREDEAVALSAAMTIQPGKVLGQFKPLTNFDALLDGPINSDPSQSANLDAINDLLGPSPSAGTILDQIEFDISSMFFQGDCLEIMPQLSAGSIDHIVTDIPYGIEMTNLESIKNLDTVVDTHDVEQNVSMMKPFLENSFRLLKDSGFCVFWYDLDHHEKLHQWAKEVGFTAQRWPLVWHKLHPCRNNAATKNFTKNVEFAMVLRKGKVGLIEPQVSSLVPADGSIERKLYDNPFAKPSAVWRFIYSAIAFKGQVVWDPFLGQASSARAALDLGLTPMGCEIDTNHFNRAIVNIKQKLSETTNGKATFK